MPGEACALAYGVSRAATRTASLQNRCDAMAHRVVSCVWQKRISTGVIWVVSAGSLTVEL